jgi:hypothetical protein
MINSDLQELACHQESSMKNEHDLFEKFPDGSSLWRDTVPGLKIAHLRLMELARRSQNEFYALNLTTGESLALNAEWRAQEFRAPSKAERRSKSQVA